MLNFKKASKKKGGFTLIELIVVIAILAILAVVIVPRVTGFVESAKVSARDSNAQMLFNTVTLVLSQDLISTPGEMHVWDALADDTSGHMSEFLDEWPVDAMSTEESPSNNLIVKINSSLAVEIEGADGGHLLGVEIGAPTP